MADDEENDNDVPSEGQSDQQHLQVQVLQVNPLNVPNIVENVLKHLKTNELKKARLVNKTWEKEANKFINKNYTMTFLQSGHLRGTRATTMQTHLSWIILDGICNPRLSQLYQNFDVYITDPNEKPWSGLLRVFGPELKSLKLTTSFCMRGTPNLSSVFEFGRILNSTPQLTFLALDIKLWNTVVWCQESGQGEDQAPEVPIVQLNCLKTLKLTVEKEMARELWRTFWKKTRGIGKWNASPIWTVLLNIIKGSPNLETLDIRSWYFLPGSILNDMLNEVSPHLTTLLLCSGGNVQLTTAAGDDEKKIIETRMDYFDMVPAFGRMKIKTLKFPRPDKTFATRQNWTNFFSTLAPTLVNLDLRCVHVNSPFPVVDIYVAAQLSLRQLHFDVEMTVLSSLILHISMFSPELTSATMPALRDLTLIIDNMEELLTKFGKNSDDDKPESESESEHPGKNLDHVSKLTCNFQDDRKLTRYEVTRQLFNVFKDYIPNLQSLELTDWLGVDGLGAFLNVYGGTSETAEKIESLVIRNFSFHGRYDTQLGYILTGKQVPDVQDLGLQGLDICLPPRPNSLKSFTNLRSFLFGVSRSVLSNLHINTDFVHNSICHLGKLETLELQNLTIDKNALDAIRATLPNLRLMDVSKCTVLVQRTANWNDDESSDEDWS